MKGASGASCASCTSYIRWSECTPFGRVKGRLGVQSAAHMDRSMVSEDYVSPGEGLHTFGFA